MNKPLLYTVAGAALLVGMFYSRKSSAAAPPVLPDSRRQPPTTPVPDTDAGSNRLTWQMGMPPRPAPSSGSGLLESFLNRPAPVENVYYVLPAPPPAEAAPDEGPENDPVPEPEPVASPSNESDFLVERPQLNDVEPLPPPLRERGGRNPSPGRHRTQLQ